MKKLLASKFYLAGLIFLWATTGMAATGLNVGALGGFSSVSSNGNSTSAFGFGARAGYQINPNWEVSADWIYGSTTPSGAASGYSSSLSLALVNLDYHFLGDLSGLYLGPKIGLGFTSAGGYSGSSFAFGGEAGYDFMFGNLSVGPLVQFSSISAPTLNGATGNSATALNALAAIKYWF